MFAPGDSLTATRTFDDAILDSRAGNRNGRWEDATGTITLSFGANAIALSPGFLVRANRDRGDIRISRLSSNANVANTIVLRRAAPLIFITAAGTIDDAIAGGGNNMSVLLGSLPLDGQTLINQSATATVVTQARPDEVGMTFRISVVPLRTGGLGLLVEVLGLACFRKRMA